MTSRYGFVCLLFKPLINLQEVLWALIMTSLLACHLLLFSLSVMSDSLGPHGLQHPRCPCPSLSPGVCSNSRPLSQWCQGTSHPLCPLLLLPSIFPSIISFPMSQLFTSCGQSIGASAPASAIPINSQGWFPLGLTGLISLLSKGFSRVFSSTTVWKHQFFGA